MDHPLKLGGFKILKDMAGFCLILPETPDSLPAAFCRLIAEKKINLPYITCIRKDRAWDMHILVDAHDGLRTSLAIQENFGETCNTQSKSAILSIFPHKNNPEILGRLFEVLYGQGLQPEALANSPSAISVVLEEELIIRAGNALFEPFYFSAYRTPEDWRSAQEGKELLYKEVVASYQEKRPKVYGFEYYDLQALFRFHVSGRDRIPTAGVLKDLAGLEIPLTFSAAGPCPDKTTSCISVCLPASGSHSFQKMIHRAAPEAALDIVSPVSVFSMNGPHFGDRYGIASGLLTALEGYGVDLLCLSCTIASVTGVVPSPQLDSALLAIQSFFEVPAVIKR